MMPSARRSSEENAMRCPMACRGEVSLARLAVHLDVPGVGVVGAVDQPDQLGAPGAQEPGDADHLAVVDVEVGRCEDAPATDPGRPEDRCGGAVDGALRAGRDGLELVEHAADHLGDQVGAGQVFGAVLADELAVAQHRDAVGDLVDLVQEVADEQDGDALVAQVPDDREQPVDLVAVQARRRLVEDQHPGVEDHRPADRDQLLDRDRVAGQQRVGVEPDPEVLQVPGRLAVGAPSSRCRAGCGARGRA